MCVNRTGLDIRTGSRRFAIELWAVIAVGDRFTLWLTRNDAVPEAKASVTVAVLLE